MPGLRGFEAVTIGPWRGGSAPRKIESMKHTAGDPILCVPRWRHAARLVALVAVALMATGCASPAATPTLGLVTTPSPTRDATTSPKPPTAPAASPTPSATV